MAEKGCTQSSVASAARRLPGLAEKGRACRVCPLRAE